MVSYHEMMVGQPRNTPAERKQFLVCCLIMAGIAIHSALASGILAPLFILRGTFPGGEYVYKSMTKDYVASVGTLRAVASDLGLMGDNDVVREEEIMDEEDYFLYAIFFDNDDGVTGRVPGGKTRFAGGALLSGRRSAEGENSRRRRLLMIDANERIANDVTAAGSGRAKDARYEIGYLPTVDAAVAYHPYNDGIWSALLQTYKIIPKFKKYADENGGSGHSPVIISTCSVKQKMCTYYMPLAKRDEFFMGKKTTEEYAKEFADMGRLERMGITRDGSLEVYLGNLFRGLKRAVGLGGGGDSSTKKKSEL